MAGQARVYRQTPTVEHQRGQQLPGYEEPQYVVVEGEGRQAALLTVTAFVEHLERIANQASELERQRFAPLLKRLEKALGSLLPTTVAAFASQRQEEEEIGEIIAFDKDS